MQTTKPPSVYTTIISTLVKSSPANVTSTLPPPSHSSIPGILSTILIVTLIAVVSLTIAKLLDYLYVRQPIKDDASDVSDNTKELLRQQFEILKFSLDEDKRRLRRLSSQFKSKSSKQSSQQCSDQLEDHPSVSVTVEGVQEEEELDSERVGQLMSMWTNSIISKIQSGNFPMATTDEIPHEFTVGEPSEITMNAKQMATEVTQKAPPPGTFSSLDVKQCITNDTFNVPTFPSSLDEARLKDGKHSKYAISIV